MFSGKLQTAQVAHCCYHRLVPFSHWLQQKAEAVSSPIAKENVTPFQEACSVSGLPARTQSHKRGPTI